MPAVMGTGCSLLIAGLHQTWWVGLMMTSLSLAVPLVLALPPAGLQGSLRWEGVETAAGWVVRWDPARPREKQRSL